ncbi:MAG: hypothetical protein EBS05_02690 [Proteobacteria bacterium]|nr:hypothetical protein [Pseudomonadota bacterium]
MDSVRYGSRLTAKAAKGWLMADFETIWRAIRTGLIVEFLLCLITVVYVVSGPFGPCGPVRNVTGFVYVIHLPGTWLAGCFVRDSSNIYPLLAMGTTTVMLSLLAHVGSRVFSGKKRKLGETKPAAAGAVSRGGIDGETTLNTEY